MNRNLFKILLAILLFPVIGLSLESLPNEIIVEIQAAIQKEKSQNRPIIAIGGCPGVGKSTFAKLLQTELAKKELTSCIISLDHYGLSQEDRKQFTNELDPRRIEWNKLHSTLTEIKKGSLEIVKPIVNQLTKERGLEKLILDQVDCIIFEGSYTLSDVAPMDYLQYVDLAIYLESSLENIYNWKWERELKKFQSLMRSSTAFFFHMRAILEDFAFHVYPSRNNAKYIIQKDSSHKYSCESLKTKPTPNFTDLRLETLTY